MSTLNGSSSLAQIKAAFGDAASYAEDDSITKARAFKTAVILLMQRTPKRTRIGGSGSGEEIEFDHATLRRFLDDVNRWIAAHPSAGGVRHFSVERFRD